MALGEYPPLTEAELDAWEERARGPKDWAADYVLRLIAEIRRLRKALDVEALERQAEGAAPPISPEERAARIHAARGSMAHIPGSVEDFLRRKHEDIEWEDRHWTEANPEAPEDQKATSPWWPWRGSESH